MEQESNSQPDSKSQAGVALDPLDPVEIRVLSVLAEKEGLTPDIYPLSLNALTNGCNQLSSRDPVMSVTEQEVEDALQRLLQRRLVSEIRQAGARVVKYDHRMRIVWSLEQSKLAALVMLMLRGAQTAGEIRSRSGRLESFDSVEAVESCLQFLIDKYPPLAARLPRAPGTKEVRYAHLLGGEFISETADEAPRTANVSGTAKQDRIAALEDEVASLREQVASLGRQFDDFKKQFE